MVQDWLKKLSEFVKSDRFAPILTLVALACVLTYGFGNTLNRAVQSWDNPRYSHGYLIPFFALFLLWLRRESFGRVPMATRWWGAAVVCAGLVTRVGASYLAVMYLEMGSYLICLVGLFILAGGWSTLRWAGPPIGYLVFMFPLPMVADRMLLDPLQKVATIGSTFCLQTIGFVAVRSGNRINLGYDDLQLGVVDACSGLRMLTIFMALAVAITFVTDRPWWERILIVASAVPIAVAVNVTRITVTGVLYLIVSHEISDFVFHDVFGWLMMPLALGLLYLEVQILSRLFIEEDPSLGSLGLEGVSRR